MVRGFVDLFGGYGHAMRKGGWDKEWDSGEQMRAKGRVEYYCRCYGVTSSHIWDETSIKVDKQADDTRKQICTLAHTHKHTHPYNACMYTTRTHTHTHIDTCALTHTHSLFPETEQAIHKRLGDRAGGRADEWTNGQVYATALPHKFWIGLTGGENEMNKDYAE